MAETVNLPKLGFDMREGTFLNWVKNVGDAINQGDVIAEIESDKATIEVESPVAGTLLQTLVNVGDVVPVGNPIAMVGAAGEAPASGTGNNSSNGSAAPKAATEPAPASAPAAGSSAPAAVSAPAAPASTPPPAPAASVAPEPVDEDLPDGLRASPVARRMAEEKNIDLRLVKGTGPNGRIRKEDVENYSPAAVPAQVAPPAPAPAAPASPTLIASANTITITLQTPPPLKAGMEEVPLSRLRQRIAARLIESKQTTPHFYITSEIDMDAALALRKQINEQMDDAHKVTVNDMIVKATALALRQFLQINSHYYGDKLIKYHYINVGIAVAMDGGGLINVVAKDADKVSLSAMAARNKEMIAGGRTGKVKPEDIEGSTFTTSNLGPYEVDQFVAIINPPEAGIIAVGSAKQIPVIVNGEVKFATHMKATLSADHRVTDGAEGAQFMLAFKKLLENPWRLV